MYVQLKWFRFCYEIFLYVYLGLRYVYIIQVIYAFVHHKPKTENLFHNLTFYQLLEIYKTNHSRHSTLNS